MQGSEDGWQTAGARKPKKAAKEAPSLEELVRGRPRVLVVLRGLPGCGKSTLVAGLEAAWVASADDYFLDASGRYVYDGRQIGRAHQWAQNKARLMLEQGLSPVVVDNTNVCAWEAKAYVEPALAHGYEVEILTPNTPWRFDPVELARRNRHGVPEVAIRRMLSRWEDNVTVDTILAAKIPHHAKPAGDSKPVAPVVAVKEDDSTEVVAAALAAEPVVKQMTMVAAAGMKTCRNCGQEMVATCRFCTECAVALDDPVTEEVTELLGKLSTK